MELIRKLSQRARARVGAALFLDAGILPGFTRN